MVVVHMIVCGSLILLLVALILLFQLIDFLEYLALVLYVFPIGIADHVLLTVGGLHLGHLGLSQLTVAVGRLVVWPVSLVGIGVGVASTMDGRLLVAAGSEYKHLFVDVLGTQCGRYILYDLLPTLMARVVLRENRYWSGGLAIHVGLICLGLFLGIPPRPECAVGSAIRGLGGGNSHVGAVVGGSGAGHGSTDHDIVDLNATCRELLLQ